MSFQMSSYNHLSSTTNVLIKHTCKKHEQLWLMKKLLLYVWQYLLEP